MTDDPNLVAFHRDLDALERAYRAQTMPLSADRSLSPHPYVADLQETFQALRGVALPAALVEAVLADRSPEPPSGVLVARPETAAHEDLPVPPKRTWRQLWRRDTKVPSASMPRAPSWTAWTARRNHFATQHAHAQKRLARWCNVLIPSIFGGMFLGLGLALVMEWGFGALGLHMTEPLLISTIALTMIGLPFGMLYTKVHFWQKWATWLRDQHEATETVRSITPDAARRWQANSESRRYLAQCMAGDVPITLHDVRELNRLCEEAFIPMGPPEHWKQDWQKVLAAASTPP